MNEAQLMASHVSMEMIIYSETDSGPVNTQPLKTELARAGDNFWLNRSRGKSAKLCIDKDAVG